MIIYEQCHHVNNNIISLVQNDTVPIEDKKMIVKRIVDVQTEVSS